MSPARLAAALEAAQRRRAAAEARIDAAFWRFTRCARALPPVLAEPAAYAERRRMARICAAIMAAMRRDAAPVATARAAGPATLSGISRHRRRR